MGIEEQLLAAAIRNTIAQANQAVSQLFWVMQGHTLDNVEEGPHADALEEAESTLAFYTEKVFRDTAILAERLGLPLFRADIMKKRQSFKSLHELDFNTEDLGSHSKALNAAYHFFDSLSIMTEGRAVSGLGVFETVLENTPKIIDAAGIFPENEAQVRAEVRKILGFSFRDVVREIPFPTNIKTYRPDIGIPSLMAAAEYKFIDSAEEAKKCLGEVYTDMKGYSGRYDWRSFYAVLYMTKPFYSQKDIDEEFRLVKAELSWTPIVVVGQGARPKKSQTAGSASSKTNGVGF